jgi:hypothetical protein
MPGAARHGSDCELKSRFETAYFGALPVGLRACFDPQWPRVAYFSQYPTPDEHSARVVQIKLQVSYLEPKANFMTVQHCLNQSAECRRLMKLTQSEAEAQVLKNISRTWTGLAGQIDRYNALKREQRRVG